MLRQVAEARPGVLKLMDQVLGRADIAKGICSAATKGGFDQASYTLTLLHSYTHTLIHSCTYTLIH